MLKGSKKQNLEQGAAVLLLSTVLVKLIGALFKIPLSSRACLGDLGFGYFSSAYDLFTPVYMMAISGFPVAISRMVAGLTAKQMQADRVFKVSRRVLFLIGISGSVLLALAVVPFVSLTDKTGQTVYSLFAIAPAFLFCCIVSCYRGYYEGISDMTPAAVSNVIEALGKLVLGFSFALLTVRFTNNVALGAAAALIGITLGTLISALYLHIRYKFDIRCSDIKDLADSADGTTDRELARILVLTAVPIVLSSLSGSFVTLVDTLTVRWQLNIIAAENFEGLTKIYSAVIKEYNALNEFALSKEQLPTFLYGIRSKAYTIYNIIPTFTTALGVSAVPALAAALAKGEREVVKSHSQTVLKFISTIVFPAGLGLIYLPNRVMALLYGKGASAELGGKMLFILAFAVIFAGFAVPLCSMLQALSQQKKALLNVGIGIAIKILGNLLLCSVLSFNVFGSVISTLLCYFVIFVLNMSSLLKITGNAFETFSVLLKPFIAAVACGTAAFFTSLSGESSLITVVSIAVGAIVYISVLLLLKVISSREIAKFIKK